MNLRAVYLLTILLLTNLFISNLFCQESKSKENLILDKKLTDFIYEVINGNTFEKLKEYEKFNPEQKKLIFDFLVNQYENQLTKIFPRGIDSIFLGAVPPSITIDLKSSITTVAFHPNNNFIFAGCEDSNIYVWDIRNTLEFPKLIAKLTNHTEAIKALEISPDSKYMLSSSKDNTTKIWDLSQLNTYKSFENLNINELAVLDKHEKEVSSIAISNDSKLAVIADLEPKICLWDISNISSPIKLANLNIRDIDFHSSISVLFSPCNKFILLGEIDQKNEKHSYLWDIQNQSEPKILCKGERAFEWWPSVSWNFLKISPNKKFALSGYDHCLFITNIESLDYPKFNFLSIEKHYSRFISASFNTDGKYAVLGTFSQNVRNKFIFFLLRFNEPDPDDEYSRVGIENIAKLYHDNNFSNRFTSVVSSFSNNGKYILTGSMSDRSNDKFQPSLKLWDLSRTWLINNLNLEQLILLIKIFVFNNDELIKNINYVKIFKTLPIKIQNYFLQVLCSKKINSTLPVNDISNLIASYLSFNKKEAEIVLELEDILNKIENDKNFGYIKKIEEILTVKQSNLVKTWLQEKYKNKLKFFINDYEIYQYNEFEKANINKNGFNDDYYSNRALAFLKYLKERVLHVAVSFNNKYALTQGYIDEKNEKVKLWDVRNCFEPKLACVFEPGLHGRSLVSNDGNLVLTLRTYCKIDFWDLTDRLNPRIINSLQWWKKSLRMEDQDATLMAISPNDKYLLVCSASGYVYLWNISTLTRPYLMTRFIGHRNYEYKFSRDSKILYAINGSDVKKADLSNMVINDLSLSQVALIARLLAPNKNEINFNFGFENPMPKLIFDTYYNMYPEWQQKLRYSLMHELIGQNISGPREIKNLISKYLENDDLVVQDMDQNITDNNKKEKIEIKEEKGEEMPIVHKTQVKEDSSWCSIS